MRSIRTCFLLSLGILVSDFISKAWVSSLMDKLPPRLPINIFSDFFGIRFSITYEINTGAAWGFLSDFPNALVIVRLLLIVALIFYLFFVNHRSSWNIPLALIITGAIGNVIDYFYYGYVVDMIQFRFWGYDYPVFNIADSAIFIGAVWILCSSFMEKSET